ncbi:MAG TPA: extracellular solute-binding protein [Chloroflexota bacterium]|nr:extracellular solute-binding protein [Chloroflexota bacterium]
MRTRTHLSRIVHVGAAAALLATTLGAGISHAAPTKAPVTLTFWSWVPHLQDEVNLFEKARPDIKVNLVNVGQGAPFYTKLRTALKAGSGAPDVTQIEFQYMPTFELTGKLVDLSQYGANAYKKDFVPWTWDQVSQGSKVYSIPQDSGPMALLYRADIFAKYHLAVPATWAQYQQEAITLHKDNPKIYMTEFAANDGGWINSLLWQAGAWPFKVNGTSLSIDFTSAKALQVVNYWGSMVKAGVLSTVPDFTTSWYTGLANGTIASWPTAGWGPVFLAGQAAKTTGKWRAAPLPQWTAGAHASGNWGGSTDAVTTQSQHPKEAAEFAIWLNDNFKSASQLASEQFLFPTTKAVLNSPSFDSPQAFYGGQKVNGIFATASSHVDLGFQWSPFQDYVYSQMGVVLGNAVNGKTSFSGALSTLQSTLVGYAKNQGFTVQ